eukprot:NODE_4864_length_1008_cov_146.111864_g4657_i0.p1 GENE.NODE_4864_length_1008_cov_146.111864_g4657_i0~~NODE_4864_length_1008_cov_146.111864_g4657_i0.p1  ORF type:complete len:277 (-),score=95.96 NODE_4864_length_1008_cov_146.111864_g4657_i0:177-962(-)
MAAVATKDYSQPAADVSTICVGNLPDAMSLREFRCLFKFAWGFQRCSVNQTSKGRQVGYARFSTPAEASQAIEYLQGFPLDEDFPHPAKVFMSSTQLSDELLEKAKLLNGGNRKRGFNQAFGMGGMGMGMMGGRGMGGMGGMGMGMGGMGMGMGMGGMGMMGMMNKKPRVQGPPDPMSIYVGGVPAEWDENKLIEMFSPFGSITNVSITGGSNPMIGSIAFIYYSMPQEATAAIQSMNEFATGGGKHLVVRQNTSRGPKKE